MGDVPMSCFRLMGGSQSLSTFRLIRSQSLWQQLGKYALNPIYGETGRWVFLPSPSSVNLERVPSGSAYAAV